MKEHHLQVGSFNSRLELCAEQSVVRILLLFHMMNLPLISVMSEFSFLIFYLMLIRWILLWKDQVSP